MRVTRVVAWPVELQHAKAIGAVIAQSGALWRGIGNTAAFADRRSAPMVNSAGMGDDPLLS